MEEREAEYDKKKYLMKTEKKSLRSYFLKPVAHLYSLKKKKKLIFISLIKILFLSKS